MSWTSFFLQHVKDLWTFSGIEEMIDREHFVPAASQVVALETEVDF